MSSMHVLQPNSPGPGTAQLVMDGSWARCSCTCHRSELGSRGLVTARDPPPSPRSFPPSEWLATLRERELARARATDICQTPSIHVLSGFWCCRFPLCLSLWPQRRAHLVKTLHAHSSVRIQGIRHVSGFEVPWSAPLALIRLRFERMKPISHEVSVPNSIAIFGWHSQGILRSLGSMPCLNQCPHATHVRTISSHLSGLVRTDRGQR